MRKKPAMVIRLGVVCSFIFSQFVFIQPSYATTPTYTAELTVSGFSGATWITRGGGFIWVSQNSAIRKVNETTGTITETFSLTSTPQEIVYDGTNIFALLANNKIVKIVIATSVVSYSLANACGTYSSNNSIAANPDVIIVSCFSTGRVARFQNTNLSELESVSLTSAGRTVIANSSAYVTQFSGANPTWKYSLSSLSSPTSIATANYSNSVHRVTADNNYVWILSGNSSQTIRLVRISLTNDSVTTIPLTGYAFPTYTLNSLSSNGSTLFISLGNNRRILALDIATSSFADVATPSSIPDGIQAVTNGFWVAQSSTLVKYASPAITANFNSFALAGNATSATFRTAVTINASVDTSARVTFQQGRLIISGCKNKVATGSGSVFTTSCTWKPSQRGSVTLSATATPVAGGNTGSAIPVRVFVINRTGTR
jgi:hypothetical protein